MYTNIVYIYNTSLGYIKYIHIIISNEKWNERINKL